MARKLVNGTVPAIGSVFGTTTNITALTNAANAVATFAAGHAIVVGDFVQIMASGWGGVEGRVFRASAVATNDITLEGFNTSSTTLYPAGGGVGSGRRITTWQSITQVNADGLTVDGGEQQFLDGQYIDTSLAFRVPTNKSPIGLQMVLDDDQTMTQWTPIRAAEVAVSNFPVRLAYPGGGFAVGSGIWTISSAPALTGNNVQKRTLNVALASIFSEYTT